MKLIVTVTLLVLTSPLFALAQDASREINVQAESWVSSSPDFARVTILIEENGASVVAVAESLDKKYKNISEAIIDKAKNTMVRSRGRTFEGADAPGSAVMANAVIHATDHIAAETGNINLVPTIIAEALKAGGTSITETRYYVRANQEKRLQAINEATDRAKEKALHVAQSLGIRLGHLLGIIVGEEEDGAIVLQQRMQGEEPLQYRDKDVRIIVNARFEAISQELP